MTDIIKFKKSVPTVGKSFRLLDFAVFDDRPQKEHSSDEDSGNRFSARRTNTDEAKFMIQMFGVSEKGETCCIFVNDFKPFFYVKVGNSWTPSDAGALLREIKKNVGKFYEDSVLSAELVEYQKLYGFSGGCKDKFVKFVFKNTTTLNKVKNLWYIYVKPEQTSSSRFGNERKLKPMVFQGISLELYESNIPPILRYFHIQNISPSGWIYVPTAKVFSPPTKSTTCTYEYVCMAAQLKAMPEKETRVPYKICSFDIEASSSHGDFPIPIKTYKRLASTMVDVFLVHGQNGDKNGTAKNSTLLNKVILSAFGFDTFDDVDLVYPKTAPTKEKIKQLISLLLTKPIENAKRMNEEEDNAHLLTIDLVFEKMKELRLQEENRIADGLVDGDDDDDNDKTNEIDGPAFYNGNKKKQVKTERSATIIDVLMGENYERDEKVQLVNEVLTMLFPRLEGDTVTFIGSTFLQYGNTEPYMNHCLVVGSCDDVDGAVIETALSERELLIKWTALIQRENPDIIIGYNIFGFDYEFMFRRAQENNCTQEFLLLSRKIGELSAKTDYKTGEISIENTQIQLASGEYDLYYPKITGRVQIDMYTYIRRDFTLPSFKLDDVASQFISDDVKKIEHTVDSRFGEVTELYSQNLSGLHVGDFIHIELSVFTADYYKNGKKFRVLDIIRDRPVVETVKGKEVTTKYNVLLIDGHEHIGTGKTVKWTMAKDDVTPQDIFRLAKGSSADRAVVAKYCIQDCNLVQHLMNKIDVITGYVEMSRICSVPITFLIFRGQGIKLTSYVAKKCMEKNTLMPDLEKTDDADGYEGALVLSPKCSMYVDNPVACVDYASLYPSAMISQNYSHNSKVWTKEYDLAGNMIKQVGEQNRKGEFIYDNMPGYEYIDVEFDTFKYIRKTKTSRAEKMKSGKKICRWAQFPDNKKGILPAILEELLKARADTRKMIQTEKDPFMKNILDKRQLGYKVTANSLYGQCGARTSTFYEKDIAASTTATGRMMLIYAKRIIEEVYGDTVYETAVHGPVKCKAEYVYGDSVARYTPVYVMVNGQLDICTIESLATKYGGGLWTRCLEEGKQEKEVCELNGVETWSDKGWTRLFRVIRHALAPHKKMMRIMTHQGLVDATDDHSLVRSNGQEISPKDVTLGTELLHHRIPTETYADYIANNNNKDYDISGITDHLLLANYCAKKQSQGFNVILSQVSAFELARNNRFRRASSGNLNVRLSIEPYNNSHSEIQLIKPLESGEGCYVYDLTTENHHFAAGIGNMIVHNTDSVFFTFNLENPDTGVKVRGKPALEMTIEIAQDAAQLCTQYLKSPMELCYEKTLMPFILLSKKRYVGMLYETDANKGKLKYMGLSLKRRDSCDYLKDVYGGILNILMKPHSDSGGTSNIQRAIEFLDKSLNDLIDGKVCMDKLTLTKALRSDYKNPGQIAHRVLADRIGQRDPGNKPKPGDRMKFAFVVNNNKKALQGEKIETPEFILANNIQLDYMYYITNQLMKPLQQLFGLALEPIWEYQRKPGAIKTYKRDMALLSSEYEDLEIFMKKKEKYCADKVKLLLFNKFLTQIFNKTNNIQSITGFFSNK
jgi:DNA polymerase elongation subunit (family B)